MTPAKVSPQGSRSIDEISISSGYFWMPCPGLPDGIFSYPNHNLGIFWRALKWEMSVFLWPFGIYYGRLVNFVATW
jgi:hypothetical protein